jgi:hypothetical protein
MQAESHQDHLDIDREFAAGPMLLEEPISDVVDLLC